MATIQIASATATQSVATTVLIVGAASGVYAQFGPSLFTISSDFFHGQKSFRGNVQRIRQGYILSTVITVAMGWGGSVLTRSALPLLGAAIYAAISDGACEYAIAHPASEVT